MKYKDIIVVEDNDTMRLGIGESLRREGYEVYLFENGIEAIEFFENKICPIAIVDLKMEPMDGISVLKNIKEINIKTEVLIISAYGSVEQAVESMKLGAADFLTKPFSPDELRLRILKIQNKIKNEEKIEVLSEHNRILTEELSSGYGEIVGNSAVMKNLFQLITQIAENDSTILIQGESGTGKELVAHEIHKRSKRSDKPFIRVNCGALNDNLLESELFGHEKGSFTGAIKLKRGRFELADKGTIFLDEIGDISPAMQVRLLRVLQEKEFERVGGEKTISVDVRVITATNKDLQKLITQKKFRDDLYYRLNVIPVHLPPLRERKEDIAELTNHFLGKISDRYGIPSKQIDGSGVKLLSEYNYPGNIREMENLIERLVAVSPTQQIDTKLIMSQLSGLTGTYENYESLPLEEAVSAFEKNLIVQAMKSAGGVKNRAAKMLGIATSVLYYKLEKYGLIDEK
ncbi:MAG: sigma-54 dependent transcriptional regulator [bacterium]